MGNKLSVFINKIVLEHSCAHLHIVYIYILSMLIYLHIVIYILSMATYMHDYCRSDLEISPVYYSRNDFNSSGIIVGDPLILLFHFSLTNHIFIFKTDSQN